MSIQVEIIKLAQINTDKIDYNRVIFKVILPHRIELDNSRMYFILFKTLADGGARKIIVDLHDLDYIDSAGIGTIVSAAKMIRKQGGDLVMSSATANILSIFKVVSLQDFIRIFSTDGEAINHFHALNS
ncbi:MAG TPA: STAS domain-containing protein [Spirochaetota bacterium]|nr:STAS domain-containing protein [Spirochaetota bacterium]HRZ28039.1 STAS domain-containing protein [Spirochaetota bacterium]HSA15229.1 STAS domain-containing protein [Spirochaetota bacterium]